LHDASTLKAKFIYAQKLNKDLKTETMTLLQQYNYSTSYKSTTLIGIPVQWSPNGNKQCLPISLLKPTANWSQHKVQRW